MKQTTKNKRPSADPQVPGARILRPTGPSVARPTTDSVVMCLGHFGCSSFMGRGSLAEDRSRVAGDVAVARPHGENGAGREDEDADLAHEVDHVGGAARQVGRPSRGPASAPRGGNRARSAASRLHVPSYRAHGELLIELIDSTDTSVSRKVQAISLTTQDNESTRLRLRHYQGTASFVVHPGRFTSVYHIEDKESRREFGDRKQILHVLPFRPEAVVRSTVLFVEPASQPVSERSFTALNDNNAAQFSKNTGAFITLKDEEAPVTMRYSLTQILLEGKERSVVQEETTAVASVFRHSLLRLEQTNAENVTYALDSSTTTETVYFPLWTSRLKQGRYVAHIYISAGDTATVSKEFSIHWNDMPLSLYDLDFAVTAMRYITTDSEYDDLRSGNRESRIKKFEEFWAKRNTVPGAAYNEMMTVYFQRVDYAFLNFRTLKEENGALTDRGKIYILYGKPSHVERSLAPGGPPKETWACTHHSTKNLSLKTKAARETINSSHPELNEASHRFHHRRF